MRDESLNLEVRDFGPIGRAKVELRPLTVFVGPSNTGKSYLATLIYALYKHFGQFDSANWWHAENAVRQMLLENGEQLAQHVRKTLKGWAKEDKKIQLRGTSVDVMRPRDWELSNEFKELVKRAIETQGPILRHELERCFGVRIDDLKRRANRSEIEITVSRQFSYDLKEKRDRVDFKFSNGTIKAVLPENLGIEIRGRKQLADLEFALRRISASDSMEAELLDIIDLFEFFRNLAVPGLFGKIGTPAHYLPAGRAVLLDSFDVLVESLIGKASTYSEVLPDVTGVVADFVRQLGKLGKLHQKKGHPGLAKVEEEILAGSISIETDDMTGYPRFSYKPVNWEGPELPLKNASSMVSELAPIMLYDKYVLEQDDLLIVDEPEAHLHPALQVVLIRQLARLVSEGKRVLVTTHSEWLTEELANIVRRATLEEQLPRVAEPKPRADDDISLPEADVGVWRFSTGDKSGASVVEEIPIGETGLYDVGFDDVAIASHNEWARISDALGENE